jgi:hypothetical protein
MTDPVVTETLFQTVERQAREIERLASLLACWLDPMLQGEGHWAISAETLEQLVTETKSVLGNRRR